MKRDYGLVVGVLFVCVIVHDAEAVQQRGIRLPKWNVGKPRSLAWAEEDVDGPDEVVPSFFDKARSIWGGWREVVCRESNLLDCRLDGRRRGSAWAVTNRQDLGDGSTTSPGESGDVSAPGVSDSVVVHDPDLVKEPCGAGVSVGVGQKACLCPLDYVGEDCKRQRVVNCKVDMVRPARSCSEDERFRYDPGLDGDPPCLVSSWDVVLEFEFRLDCSLRGQPQAIPEGANRSDIEGRLSMPNRGFPTFVFREGTDGNDLVLTRRANVSFHLRPVRWDRIFSALEHRKYTILTVEQIEGAQSIGFQLALADLRQPGYAIAGRIFAEARVTTSNITSARCARCVQRIFIDAPEDVGSRFAASPSWSNRGSPTDIQWKTKVVPPSVLVVLTLFSMAWIRHTRNKRLHEKHS